MSVINLGRLEQVDLRDIWQSEAGAFTPWLAEDVNLALLGKTLDIELELEATEKNVGPFRADILCKNLDDSSQHWVLIENQIERTDHTHLGQLMTYAAGLKAATIVWIAREFTDEHRAAIDWLNDITNEEFRFFGIEVKLFRIGESHAAPQFNVVSKPNDWSKAVTGAKKDVGKVGELSPTKQLQLEYWKTLYESLAEIKTNVKPQKPRPQHWTNYSLGRSYFDMHARVNTRDKCIGIVLVTQGEFAYEHFKLLEQDRETIEEELGFKLHWRAIESSKQQQIILNLDHADPTDKDDWGRQHKWIACHVDKLHAVFAPRIKTLDASDCVPEDEMVAGSA
ncbi:DUF4268 domain-containing protein [Planctomycetota bacterium]|nr:DUF4268 domain-containing protein [Planctomycetota bacterium]